MPSAHDLEPAPGIDPWPAPALDRRELRKPGGRIEESQGECRARDLLAARERFGDEIVEELQLQCQGLVGGGQDFALELAQLRRCEAHGARHGLAMNETLPELRRLRRRHLDVIAEDVVVPDLEARDAALRGVAALQARDETAALVAQALELV